MKVCEFKHDRDFVLKAVRVEADVFEYVEFKDDKEVVMEAVRNGYNLYFASERLKNDEEVVMKAVKNNASSLQIASKELQWNEDFVLNVVAENPMCLGHVLFENGGFFLKAIKKNKACLDYALRICKKYSKWLLGMGSRIFKDSMTQYSNTNKFLETEILFFDQN